jgi:hypothetical protein
MLGHCLAGPFVFAAWKILSQPAFLRQEISWLLLAYLSSPWISCAFSSLKWGVVAVVDTVLGCRTAASAACTAYSPGI